MDEQDYWIPRNLDAGALFFVWDADVAILFMFWMIMGALMNMFISGVVAAIFVTRGYSYLKEEGGRGLIVKLLYWFTPSDIWITKKLPSHIREYIGG